MAEEKPNPFACFAFSKPGSDKTPQPGSKKQAAKRPHVPLAYDAIRKEEAGSSSDAMVKAWFGGADDCSSSRSAVWNVLRSTRAERKGATVEAFHSYLIEHVKEKHGDFACLVAALLSVQTQDTTAMRAMQSLEKQAAEPVTARFVASMRIEELEAVFKTTNFYKTKAKNVLAIAKLLTQNGKNGEVPLKLSISLVH